MRGKWPLKQKANVVFGTFIKMSRTMIFWYMSGRKEGNGVVSLGGGKTQKRHTSSSFQSSEGCYPEEGVELPERCSGRELKERKLRGRFGFQVILGYYILFSTLMCKCYEWSLHIFIPHYMDIEQYMVCWSLNNYLIECCMEDQV